MKVLRWVIAFGMGLGLQGAQSQTGKTCAVQHILHNDANEALNRSKYALAAELYAKQLESYPDSVAAMVGLVRSRMGERKLTDAYKLASDYVKALPVDKTSEAMLEDVYGEVRFRRGEVDEAAEAFNRALHADFCLGRVHYDIARYQALSGNYLTAQKQIDVAKKLSPDDADISYEALLLHTNKPTTEEMVATFTRQMNTEGKSDADRAKLAREIKYVQATGNGSCEMVGSKESAKVKMVPILRVDGEISKMGLDVEMNGRRKRMMVDTGASGLTITKRAAAALGLTAEAETRVGGIGDQGSVHTIVAHLDKVTIGDLEFHNCKVDVLDHDIENVDGLLGPDVFARWVVTLDMPVRELLLSPLPKLPGDSTTEEPKRLEAQGALGDEHSGEPQDRYIAPEMKDWTKAYRDKHNLILPTRVNDQPARLFIMDTGAFSGMLSPALARAVGNLVEVDTEVHGISGQVEKVYTVDKQVTITFGNVSQQVRGITVLDMGHFSAADGVELSGFIGFTALKELTISIDYRDNLVKVAFDRKRGFHSAGRMEY